MNILVTGGLGFIGSHTCVQLLENNYNLFLIDDLSNSKIEVLDKIKYLSKSNNIINFYQGTILDKKLLENIFESNNINCVIHFAGLKSVAQSISNPLQYYDTNVNGTLVLLEIMKKYNCYNIIFSSSATVYGEQVYPVNETCQTGIGITNPYGKTKYMIEQILYDLALSNSKWGIIALRYFNPIGAHKSGLLGEDPNDIPNNLMPYLLKVASGQLKILNIFGNTYKTQDGTCLRDFIHVEDLARSHVLALKNFNALKKINTFNIFNIGTGKPTSVLELINTFEKVNNIKINYQFNEKRKGDIEIVYADVSLAKKLLNFETIYSIEDCCIDSYNFINNYKNNKFEF